MRESNRGVEAWRNAVTIHANDAGLTGVLLDGPLQARITFWLPRPKKHYRANGELRPDAPTYVAVKPDNDKLQRSTFDALTQAGVIVDDARIVDVRAIELYADGSPGAHIRITSLSDNTEQE